MGYMTIMTKSVGVAEAKKTLSDLLGRVSYRGETIIILRRGKPVARLVPMSAEKGSLTSVEGWLDEEDPFFQEIERVVADRPKRRLRRR